MSKLAPSTFRRAKKCISDVLFEFEEKDELEKANSTSFARNSTQRAFSRADYPSKLSSDLSYSDTSYASASNITPPGFNPYFYGSTYMSKYKKSDLVDTLIMCNAFVLVNYMIKKSNDSKRFSLVFLFY